MTTGLPSLAAQRCHHHPEREAAARCPECGLFYCRECITEHDDRVICASCLRTLAVAKRGRGNRLGGVWRLAAGVFGIVIAWFFFYTMGRLLLLTPTSFHEGTVWEHVDDDR